jgi:hypothetical protein
MTLTVNMTSILTQREPWPVNGMMLPPNLQDVRPAPFEFGEDIRQTERPMYYFAYRVLQNLVRKIRKRGIAALDRVADVAGNLKSHPCGDMRWTAGGDI